MYIGSKVRRTARIGIFTAESAIYETPLDESKEGTFRCSLGSSHLEWHVTEPDGKESKSYERYSTPECLI